MKKKIHYEKKSSLESMRRHEIPPRGCLLASNMVEYLLRNKNSGSEVDMTCQGMAVNIARHSEKSARIHPQTMQNQCKTVKINAKSIQINGFHELCPPRPRRPRTPPPTSSGLLRVPASRLNMERGALPCNFDTEAYKINVTKCYEILLKLYNHYNVNLSKLKCPEVKKIDFKIFLRNYTAHTSLPVEAARGDSQEVGEASGGVSGGRGGHNS